MIVVAGLAACWRRINFVLPLRCSLCCTFFRACVFACLRVQQKKFRAVGNNIMGRMDEMGRKVDELERSVGDLMDQAGLDKAARSDKPSAAAAPSLATHPETAGEHPAPPTRSEF